MFPHARPFGIYRDLPDSREVPVATALPGYVAPAPTNPLDALRREVALAEQRTGAVLEAQRAERVAIETRLAALNEVLAPVEDDERAARARLRDAEARALGPWVVAQPPLRWTSAQLHLASRMGDRAWHTSRAWLRVVTGGGNAAIGQLGPRYARWTLDLHPLGSAGKVQYFLGDAGNDPAGEWLRHRAEAERLVAAEGYVLTAPGQEVRDEVGGRATR